MEVSHSLGIFCDGLECGVIEADGKQFTSISGTAGSVVLSLSFKISMNHSFG